MPKSKIPDRWTDYRPFHEVIRGTRFLPFKVPLKEHLNIHLEDPSQQFSPKNFMQLCSDKNLKIGMVIDLTYTTRYYNGMEFESNGIVHKKIFTEGHVIPNMSVLREFTNAVKYFIDTAPPDSVIAVHCTHGVNRTGYILCHYMIHELDMTPAEAISAFADGRGHPIERPLYLASLREQKRVSGNGFEFPSIRDRVNCLHIDATSNTDSVNSLTNGYNSNRYGGSRFAALNPYKSAHNDNGHDNRNSFTNSSFSGRHCDFPYPMNAGSWHHDRSVSSHETRRNRRNFFNPYNRGRHMNRGGLPYNRNRTN